MIMNSWSSWLCLPNAGMTSVHHHAWFPVLWAGKLGTLYQLSHIPACVARVLVVVMEILFPLSWCRKLYLHVFSNALGEDRIMKTGEKSPFKGSRLGNVGMVTPLWMWSR